MREPFCGSLIRHASRPDFVFLTGDLGFKALEPLREAMPARFINAGVAEQNMIGVAAGLARTGLRPWAYSIAPFIYARPFEQIRNDIALPNLPVVLVGNGGGYGYGVMGSTHHALEDYGTLLTLQNMRVYVPAFDSDVAPIVDSLMTSAGPAYLRLGMAELPESFSTPKYAAWRQLVAGDSAVLLVTGPLVGGILREIQELERAQRPSVWLVSELPFSEVPAEFVEDVLRIGHLSVLEEHVKNGGLGQMISHYLMSNSVPVRRFTHHYAQGYISGLYGSQKYHRQECHIDAPSVLATLSGANTV